MVRLSLLKRTSTTCNIAANNTLNSNGHNTLPLPQPLRRNEPFRVLAVIRTPASAHAFVEIAGAIVGILVGTPERVSTSNSSFHSQQGGVRFLQIDEAQVQGDFPLSSKFLQPAHNAQNINR